MIRTFIVDDHELIREGIKGLLSDHKDLTVLGASGSVEELKESIHFAACDVLILDILLKDKNGLSYIDELKKIHPRLRILVLSAFDEDQYAGPAFTAGAHGFLSKESAADRLVEAIQAVGRGELVFLPKYLKEAKTPGAISFTQLQTLLSSRELEVFAMIAEGSSNKEVAETLKLSAKTVSTYQKRILEKLKLPSRSQLIRYAIENGLKF